MCQSTTSHTASVSLVHIGTLIEQKLDRFLLTITTSLDIFDHAAHKMELEQFATKTRKIKEAHLVEWSKRIAVAARILNVYPPTLCI